MLPQLSLSKYGPQLSKNYQKLGKRQIWGVRRKQDYKDWTLLIEGTSPLCPLKPGNVFTHLDRNVCSREPLQPSFSSEDSFAVDILSAYRPAPPNRSSTKRFLSFFLSTSLFSSHLKECSAVLHYSEQCVMLVHENSFLTVDLTPTCPSVEKNTRPEFAVLTPTLKPTYPSRLLFMCHFPHQGFSDSCFQ